MSQTFTLLLTPFYILLAYHKTIKIKPADVKEKMYNTMNSYYKYTTIPKSSFYTINLLILRINTREKNLKYSIHFPSICDHQSL